MNEIKYCEEIIKVYGDRGYEVYEAVNAAVEEYSFGSTAQIAVNALVNRMWDGDTGALKQLADYLYGMTGSEQFKL